MNGDGTSLLAVLAKEDPAREVHLPAPAGARAVALKARIVSIDVSDRRRGRAWLAVAAVAAVATAALTLPRMFTEEHVGASPAAAAVLQRAAVAATRTTPVRPARYAFSDAQTIFGVTDTDDPPFTALIPGRRQTWVAADGSGRVRYVPGKPYFPSARDRKRWLGHGSPPLAAGGTSDEPLRRILPQLTATLGQGAGREV